MPDMPAPYPDAATQFIRQSCEFTLQQAMDEYYATQAGLMRGPSLPARAVDFFTNHDVAHVIFGCNTTLQQELAVKLFSLFGTTAGFSILHGYMLYEALDIYRDLQVRDILTTMASARSIVPITLGKCSRQRRRWPWRDHDQYRGARLCDIRSEFGISVIRS